LVSGVLEDETSYVVRLLRFVVVLCPFSELFGLGIVGVSRAVARVGK
jgi:hypothetical protein